MSIFSDPPAFLSPADQARWQARIQQAQQLAGLTEAGIIQVSQATLDLLQRYVREELTLEQVVRLQSQRLGGG